MTNHHSVLNSTARALLLALLAFVCLAPSVASAQDQHSDREQALALFDANNFVAALPFLEKAAIATPEDPKILARLGFAIYASAASETDLAARQKLRERSRQVLLRSQAVGDTSNLTMITLETLSHSDGAYTPFSNLKEADGELRKGEDAFVRGDLDQAIEAYKHALKLDPRIYEAALFAGDVEFKRAHAANDQQFRKDHFEQAGIWFARAIAIDANRETAYRYWGDALDAEGKGDEARDKFVEAIIAEPYGRRSYVGLSQWADRHQIALAHPKINIPADVAAKKAGGITITVDEQALKAANTDGSAAWMMYGFRRAMWMDKAGGRSKKFAETFPNETAYRHSLAEEVEALRGVVESVRVQKKERPELSLTPSLVNLMKLSEAGLLEAYVLFVMPDEGISRDYKSYRKANRDKLRQYWLTFVVGPPIKPVETDPRNKGL
jgi:tetratricopeptide (TPR) repeat protein